ncbi:acyl-CoA dehydrogenase family protein [Deltaproteobacteria bacterium TL4]
MEVEDQKEWNAGESTLLNWLLSHRTNQASFHHELTLKAWWDLYQQEVTAWPSPFERAIVGGMLADRLAFAFAGGYHNALRQMMPTLSAQQMVSLCITEEGGGHPKAIKTRLTPKSKSTSSWEISGSKKFITLLEEAEQLLVAVSEGFNAEARNQIRLVKLDAKASGVQVERMPDLPFVPEISHGVLHLKHVEISEDQILPGDGYAEYIKPFRTIEDIHVCAGLLGFLTRLSFQLNWPEAIGEEILMLMTGLGAFNGGTVTSPAMHIALGGFFRLLQNLLAQINPLLTQEKLEIAQRCQRDLPLMNVAGHARTQRLKTAWESV